MMAKYAVGEKVQVISWDGLEPLEGIIVDPVAPCPKAPYGYGTRCDGDCDGHARVEHTTEPDIGWVWTYDWRALESLSDPITDLGDLVRDA